MQGSIFIYSQSKEAVTNKVHEVLSDVGLTLTSVNTLTVEIPDSKKSIGIAQSREVVKFLQEKPLKHKHKAVVIMDADKLTIEAQNSLLKVLEEPPTWATIIFGGKTKSALLPTVLSRCRLINLSSGKNNAPKTSSNVLQSLLQKNIGERFKSVEELSKEDKEYVIAELEECIKTSSQSLTIKNVHNIELFLKVKKDLENTNVNTRLALEYLALNLYNE